MIEGQPQKPQQKIYIHDPSSAISFIMNSEKSPISCVHCRAHHRRCDRSIPTCMECLTRGYACAYEKPKKRGRKKKSEQAASNSDRPTRARGRRTSNGSSSSSSSSSSSNSTCPDSKVRSHSPDSVASLSSISSTLSAATTTSKASATHRRSSSTYHPYASNSNSNSNSGNTGPSDSAELNKLRANQLIELYFQLCGKCPVLIDRLQIEEHVNSEETTDLSDSPVERRAAQALLNAIQAVTLQRLGQKHDAELMFEKTRELCLQADVYESHVSNFHVAAAMITMSMWLVGERREAAAKMYLNNVHYYIDQLQQKRDELTERQERELRSLASKAGMVELMISLNFFEYEEVERKANGTGGFCDKSASKQMQSLLQKRLEICQRVLTCGALGLDKDLANLFQGIFDEKFEPDQVACVMHLRNALDKFERIDEYCQRMFSHAPILALSWSILFQGFKLELLADYEYQMVCNSDPAYLEKLDAVANLKRFVADKISRKIMLHSAWFPLTCSLHLKYVVMTALIHMRHTRYIGKHYSEDDALAFLKADLWALETTRKRYNFPKSEELISNLKSCIDIISARRNSMRDQKGGVRADMDELAAVVQRESETFATSVSATATGSSVPSSSSSHPSQFTIGLPSVPAPASSVVHSNVSYVSALSSNGSADMAGIQHTHAAEHSQTFPTGTSPPNSDGSPYNVALTPEQYDAMQLGHIGTGTDMDLMDNLLNNTDLDQFLSQLGDRTVHDKMDHSDLLIDFGATDPLTAVTDPVTPSGTGIVSDDTTSGFPTLFFQR